MKAFVAEALRAAEAEVAETEHGLRATLPEAGPGAVLARRLQASELELIFDVADLAPGRELVAPGSRLLRHLDAFLAERAGRTYVVAPATHRLTVKALRQQLSAPRGLTVGLGTRSAAVGYDVYVTYALHYRSIEREDALETVRVDLRPGRPPEVSVTDGPPEIDDLPARARKALPEEAWDAVIASADVAIAAHARAVAHSRREENRERFKTELSRLYAYYSGQIAEYERRRRSPSP